MNNLIINTLKYKINFYKTLYQIIKYQNLRKNNNKSLKNIRIITVTTICNLARFFFKVPVLKKNHHNPQYLIISTNSRNDLNSFISGYLEQIDCYKIYNDQINIKFSIDFILIVTSIRILFEVRKKIKNILNEYKKNRIEKIEIISYILMAIKSSLHISNELKDIKVILSFQEMTVFENMLIQLANNLGKVTVSIPHGIGFYDKNHTINNNYASVIYKSSVCEYVCCWGKYHVNLFESFGKKRNKLVITGAVNVPEFEKIQDGILIIFDSDENDNSILESLANDLELLNIKISRWYKPDSNLAKKKNIIRDGKAYEVVVGSKSTLLVYLAINKFRVYTIPNTYLSKVKNAENIICRGSDIIHKLKDDQTYPWEFWDEIVAYSGADAKLHFKKFLNNLKRYN